MNTQTETQLTRVASSNVIVYAHSFVLEYENKQVFWYRCGYSGDVLINFVISEQEVKVVVHRSYGVS